MVVKCTMSEGMQKNMPKTGQCLSEILLCVEETSPVNAIVQAQRRFRVWCVSLGAWLVQGLHNTVSSAGEDGGVHA